MDCGIPSVSTAEMRKEEKPSVLNVILGLKKTPHLSKQFSDSQH